MSGTAIKIYAKLVWSQDGVIYTHNPPMHTHPNLDFMKQEGSKGTVM